MADAKVIEAAHRFRPQEPVWLFEGDAPDLSDAQVQALGQGLGVNVPTLDESILGAQRAFDAVREAVRARTPAADAKLIADALEDIAEMVSAARVRIEQTIAERPFRSLTILTRVERMLRHMADGFEARNAEGA